MRRKGTHPCKRRTPATLSDDFGSAYNLRGFNLTPLRTRVYSVSQALRLEVGGCFSRDGAPAVLLSLPAGGIAKQLFHTGDAVVHDAGAHARITRPLIQQGS
jgi:hypothetical protein